MKKSAFLALVCSALLLVGCSQAVITKTQIIKQKVPENLLHLKELKKPVIADENDILKAYSDLFLHYKECVINVDKIKALNTDE